MDGNSLDENFHKCCIFIDNSNLFIEGQKAYAKKQQFLGVDKDFRFRINCRNLMDILTKDRTVLYAAFYCSGHLPAKLWKIICKKNIQAFRFHRNERNHEKQVDTTLTAHVTRKAIEMGNLYDVDLTFVIVAGDGDYIHAFEQVRLENFKLEVYAWKDCLSKRITEFAEKTQNKDKVVIHCLDQYITNLARHSVCFMSNKWDESKFEIPQERSVVFKYTKGAPDAHELTEEVTKIIKLPCKYSQPDPNTIIVIIVPEQFERSANVTCLNQITVTRVSQQTRYNIQVILRSIEQNFQREVSKQTLKILDYTSYSLSQPTDISVCRASDECDDEGDEEGNRSDDEDSNDANEAILRTFLKPCVYRYACKQGKNCAYYHSKKEKNHFDLHPSLLGGKYKSKNCQYFEKGTCYFKVCIFAHGLKEARCYFCDPGGKVMGHWMDDCPNKKY